MLNLYVDSDNSVVEMTIGGKVTREDLSKAIEELEGPLADWEEVNVLKRVDSFSGMEFMAWVDDFKFAFEHFKSYKKIKKTAVVTDKDWVEKITKFFKKVTPGEVKLFEAEDIQDARQWLKG